MLKVDNSETLSAVCRVWLKNHISENTFHASVCEAARAGVDWRAVLSEAGVDPASLPRYASLLD